MLNAMKMVLAGSAAGLVAVLPAPYAKLLDDLNWDPVGGTTAGETRKVVRPMPPVVDANYRQAVLETVGMVQDGEAQRIAKARGLDIMSLTWEDTGRFKGSAVGPNISDMTIQVSWREGRGYETRAMPVIRHPNFSDLTADLDSRAFTLLVGNEKGGVLRRVSLHEFLTDPLAFLSKPGSWLGKNRTLLAPRDERVLVSAQACFLPVPKTGMAIFNPVLFNYQSVSGDPAVLTILATREGTSVTVIDNKRDAFAEGNAWGQRLFFNRNGERASLTGQRLTDFRASGGGGTGARGGAGMNMVLLIQVPLKQKNPMRLGALGGGGFGGPPVLSAPAMDAMAKRSRGSDVEAAVIGSGPAEGPFTEIGDLAIERDDRFPVRVTVQFYKATSNGVVSEADLDQIRREIDGVYAKGDAVGSLVTGGETGRISEYVGPKVQPRDWWLKFWERHRQNTGQSPAEAIVRLRRLLGDDFTARPVTELYLRDLLRKR